MSESPRSDFIVNIFNPHALAGEWIYILGRVKVEEGFCNACELWIEVDGKYRENQITYPSGKFWFWYRGRTGRHYVKFHVLNYSKGGKSYTLTSPTFVVYIYPFIPNFTPLQGEVKVYRRLTLDYVKPQLKSYLPTLKKLFGIQEIYIGGSLARKKYTFHDIDLYVKPFLSEEERIEIRYYLMRSLKLPIDIRDKPIEEADEEVLKIE